MSNILPWQLRLSGGVTPMSQGEARSFARSICEDPAYRAELHKSAIARTLPPAVECMLWHYAYGKPVEQVEVNVTQRQKDLSALSTAELAEEAQRTAAALAEARALEDAINAKGTVQ